MRTSIATVCLSGTLTEKLHACARAGFDGVEIFEPDLVASHHSPEEIRALADRLGLTLDLYQPMRDVEGVDETEFAAVLRRAEAKFALVRRLGMDLVLCCSNVATATIDDDAVSADQLRRLGDLAQSYGVRIAFEALAWGRYVDDYRRAWRIVELADHPAVGVCLDSFHVLSRGHDPAAIEAIPGEKVFFLQLADAPALSMDVLSWSRHHRLFPGEGAFDLPTFVAHVLRTGYDGPLSLEVFNDTFRQTDVARTAVHACRSLRWLEDRAAALVDGTSALRLTELAPPVGFDFVEVRAEDTTAVEEMLAGLGFTHRGRHRTKPVSLWSSGRARVVLNEQHARDLAPHVAAVGLQVPDAAAQSRRAVELAAEPSYRRTYASDQVLDAAVSPGGTAVFWTDATDGEPAWVEEFRDGGVPGDLDLVVDHVNLTQPWQVVEESVLFHRAVLGLEAEAATQVPGPRGLVRSQVMRTRDGSVRIPLNVGPPILAELGRTSRLAQHVAFRCDDVAALARRARAAGVPLLEVPANYYEDLAARFDLADAEVAALAELGLLYDRDDHGEFVHLYTGVVGEVFLEFVERRGGYEGYGAPNAGVRMAAQAG